jgi:transmembrane 9 superfamily protein 2/4
MAFKYAASMLAILLLVGQASAFYLPGVAPQDFDKDDEVTLKVNKLTSTKTQLPYEYYSLPFCKPDRIINMAENLGEVLRGDRIENSPYKFFIRRDEQCNVVCKIDKLPKHDAAVFKDKIEDEYRVNMILDNLPVAMVKVRTENGNSFKTYERGYPVGFKAAIEEGGEEKFFIHNHLRFTVLYHKDYDSNLARLVGFEVEPFSVKHDYEAPWDALKPHLSTCNPGSMTYVTHGLSPQIVEEGEEIIFSYDVIFKISDIKWASRWDTYLLMTDDQIHWFSIINSLMIVLFLSGMVAMIMMRTLHRDISKYNQLESQDEAQEETGWKLVHGDVFRPPNNAGLLCVYVGTGVQFFGMTLITMIFAVLGFLSPANRGGLMTAMLLLWVFMGLLAGYSGARLYKVFKGTEWKKITLQTAFLFPGVVFSTFFVLNCLIWGEKSSGAIPFGTMFALVFLWFGISVPLVFIGSYFGFKKPAPEDPVRTNKIPRQIPEQAWYMRPVFSILIGGILPFGAVFIELFFILTSIWLHQFYYIFGFLFIVFLILIVTCAEITIVLCYFQLCSEDYHWWWRAYMTSGSSALYLFLYAAFYFFTKLEITKLVSGVLYFGYMTMISYSFFVLTGTIGFYACYWFVRIIYGSVKID